MEKNKYYIVAIAIVLLIAAFAGIYYSGLYNKNLGLYNTQENAGDLVLFSLAGTVEKINGKDITILSSPPSQIEFENANWLEKRTVSISSNAEIVTLKQKGSDEYDKEYGDYQRELDSFYTGKPNENQNATKELPKPPEFFIEEKSSFSEICENFSKASATVNFSHLSNEIFFP